jgi:hypothetical protein
MWRGDISPATGLSLRGQDMLCSRGSLLKLHLTTRSAGMEDRQVQRQEPPPLIQTKIEEKKNHGVRNGNSTPLPLNDNSTKGEGGVVISISLPCD